MKSARTSGGNAKIFVAFKIQFVEKLFHPKMSNFWTHSAWKS